MTREPTTDDLTQTRSNPLRMRFPVDQDSTRRLKAVISPAEDRLPLWRRLLRLLKGIK